MSNTDDLIELHVTFLAAAGRAANTIRDRRTCLERLERALPFGLLFATSEQLAAWLSRPEWSRWTRHTYASHLIGFYRWAHKQRLLDSDPMADIERPKTPRGLPRPVTDEQLAKLLTAPEPLRTAFMLAAYAGLRRAEIARSRREHVTAEQIVIPVAKGGDAQAVPTHPLLWAHVQRLPAGPLVPDWDGSHFSPMALSHRVDYWTVRNGLHRVTLHQLRHWFGTTVQRESGDIRTTQELLRHASVATTQIYTAVADAAKRTAIGRLPEV